jgi:hypothetical protein
MSVLEGDIVNNLMNELGDPAAMRKTLEHTDRSNAGTSTLTILNGVGTKKLSRIERMSTHIGHLESLFPQFVIPSTVQRKPLRLQ